MTGGGFGDVAPSLAMLAAFALAGGGVFLIARKREVKRGLLMIGVGAVLVMNVLIRVWPGSAPR